MVLPFRFSVCFNLFVPFFLVSSRLAALHRVNPNFKKSDFLPQSTVSHTSDSNSEPNSGYSCEDFHLEPLKAIYYWEKKIKAKYLIWNSITLKFVKKTIMSKNLRDIKYYSGSSPRLVKSSSNSTWCNCWKICSWLSKPKTILEGTFF